MDRSLDEIVAESQVRIIAPQQNLCYLSMPQGYNDKARADDMNSRESEALDLGDEGPAAVLVVVVV